jgi:hypothetical protein
MVPQVHAYTISLLIVGNEKVQGVFGGHCMPNFVKIYELIQVLEWGAHMA